MGDMKDDFNALKKLLKEKRQSEYLDSLQYAAKILEDENFEITKHDEYSLKVKNGSRRFHYFPRSGWFQGSTAKGRGLKNLIKELRR